ncbi:transcriptional regulator [Brevundimonas albigilva]|uniref:Transcriptional regulator n=1 Tax=Brevundimonas albigilva TaxID=1312364 RepID=A0ABY4SQG0_9CAUL|nr:transcriptional regulator [Brevundimonas albigilva]URI15961.1 transcriptional regulator [Brevundimonas albigilva]
MTVKAALGTQAAATRFLNVGGKASVAGTDDSAEMACATDMAETAPIVFHLVYEDAAGNVSQRIVTVRKIETGPSGPLLLCFCHLRQRARRFSLDRVLEVFDVSTGQVHGDPTSFFLSHPLLAIAESHEDRAIRLCADDLTILTVVGAADGRFDPDEQDQLLIHVFDRYEDGALDEDLLRGRLSLLTPDYASFFNSLSRVRPEDGRLLRRSLRRMVDADGQIDPAELVFVETIEARLDGTR